MRSIIDNWLYKADCLQGIGVAEEVLGPVHTSERIGRREVDQLFGVLVSLSGYFHEEFICAELRRGASPLGTLMRFSLDE